MADTTCQVECEDWIRREWVARQFGEPFFRERVRLSSGGVFDFDAVSRDHSMIATISTSSARTDSGNWATGALMKLRSDVLFLLLAAAKRSIMVFSERNMYELCLKEQSSGRLPQQLEIFHACLPHELSQKLAQAKRRSSEESLGTRTRAYNSGGK